MSEPEKTSAKKVEKDAKMTQNNHWCFLGTEISEFIGLPHFESYHHWKVGEVKIPAIPISGYLGINSKSDYLPG